MQERDIRDTLPDPDQDHEPGGPNGGPGGPGWKGGPGGNPAPGRSPARRRGARPAGSAGPSLAALVNLTVPLSTAFGESGTPGEAAGFGLLDPQSARDLLAAAARDPPTRCV